MVRVMAQLLTPSSVLAPGDSLRPPIEALAGAWLAGYRSVATRNAYRSDLRKWFAYCNEHSLDPLTVRRSHVELFARQLEAEGGAAASVARRLSALSTARASRSIATPPTSSTPNRRGNRIVPLTSSVSWRLGEPLQWRRSRRRPPGG